MTAAEQLELEPDGSCDWCDNDERCPWHTVLPHDWPEHAADAEACCGCPDCGCVDCDPPGRPIETVAVAGGLL